MLIRTHLAFAVLLIILFVKYVTNKWIFIGVLLIASVLPDIDSGFSNVGNRWYLRPLQFFVKHRGFIHSFTFAILISIILAYFWPVAALGFFLGYSVHLFCDSFTKEGIKPFWPLKIISKGPLLVGGRVEMGLFLVLVLADVALIFLSLLF